MAGWLMAMADGCAIHHSHQPSAISHDAEPPGFAIDRRIVKLPASVLAMAIVSHARGGSGRCGTSGVKSITAGTLLTTLERIAVVALRPATVWTPSGASAANNRRSIPARAAAP